MGFTGIDKSLDLEKFSKRNNSDFLSQSREANFHVSFSSRFSRIGGKVWSADVLPGRHLVRMTFRQDGLTTLDVLSGLCLTTLDVLSGRIHVRRFVRSRNGQPWTFCQDSISSSTDCGNFWQLLATFGNFSRLWQLFATIGINNCPQKGLKILIFFVHFIKHYNTMSGLMERAK